MKKAINVVVENFNTMRTGRANPAILDKILVPGDSGGRLSGSGGGQVSCAAGSLAPARPRVRGRAVARLPS
jgi:hypothetical protein